MFMGNVTLDELTSVFVFLRDGLWVGDVMSYYINIQLFAFSAELKEMFLSLVTSMGVPESSNTNIQTLPCVDDLKNALNCVVITEQLD